MSFKIRPADLQTDCLQMVRLMLENLTPYSTLPRFEWLYCQNPIGKAKAWVAVDDGNNEMVGSAAIFPRMLYVHGVNRRGWVLGDFCLSARYRSLGPALALQRTCLRFLDEDQDTPFYDFPSQVMLAIYQRLGKGAVQMMKRATKPIRIDRKVQSWLPITCMLGPVSWVGNYALKLFDLARKPSGERTIAFEDGPWGEEFTALSHSMSNQFGVFVHRSSAYVNWRFGENPLKRYRIIVAREEGELVGYSVLGDEREDVVVEDLFGNPSTGVLDDLLYFVCQQARKEGKLSLLASVPPQHKVMQTFSRQGFYLRESFPLIVPAPDGQNEESNEWFLLSGDRDS